MNKYTIEGSICFMVCGPYMEPVFEVYDRLPDGRIRYIINERPKYQEDSDATPKN